MHEMRLHKELTPLYALLVV